MPVKNKPEADAALIAEQTVDQHSVAYWKSEKARINAELKTARAAERAKRVRPAIPVNAVKGLLPRVRARIKKGEQRDGALDAELHALRVALNSALDAEK
jgi:septal ring factor EnvC (AmiA/AmiB activator)